MSKQKVSNVLMFLLGLFSTLQIFELFSLTLFTILLIITGAYYFLSHRIKLKNNVVLYYGIACCLTTIFVFINPNFKFSYLNQSIVGFLSMILVLALYFLIKDKAECNNFIKGFKISCYIQLIWCLCQIAIYTIFKVDLNKIVFNDILQMTGEYSYYRDGRLVATGLHWHSANLTPILIFLFFSSKNIIIKIMCIAITYFTQSATQMIAIILSMLYYVFYFFKNEKEIFNKKRNNLFYINLFGIIFIFVVLIIVAMPIITNTIQWLIARILQINSTIGGTSSAVHFSYYTRLPFIYSNISIYTKIFGIGISSSGLIFSSLFNQYTELIWVVESDFVNVLLSQGIIGCVLFYLVLDKCALLICKYDAKYAYMIGVFIICGFVYNIQFTWVILLELILLKKSELSQLQNFGGNYSDITKCNYSNL